jgi:quinolinate synthase
MNIASTSSSAQALYTQVTAPDSQANPQLAMKVLKEALDAQQEEAAQLVKSVVFYDNSGQEVTAASNKVDLRV